MPWAAVELETSLCVCVRLCVCTHRLAQVSVSVARGLVSRSFLVTCREGAAGWDRTGSLLRPRVVQSLGQSHTANLWQNPARKHLLAPPHPDGPHRMLNLRDPLARRV